MTTPLLVGIAGGTGSGKSTIARKIAEGLPASQVAVIDHDAYYLDRSGMPPEERQHINFDHPQALDNSRLAADLDKLRQGCVAEVPIYDFVTHTRKAERRVVRPAPVIILEGILVFVDPNVRRRLDVKIFVDTDADIRLFRRIRRDMEGRGRTFAQVREQYYSTVRPMHLQFVEPSKRWADLIIPEGGNNHVALDLVLSKLLSVVTEPVATPVPASRQTSAPSRLPAHDPDPACKAEQRQPPPPN